MSYIPTLNNNTSVNKRNTSKFEVSNIREEVLKDEAYDREEVYPFERMSKLFDWVVFKGQKVTNIR